MSATPLGVTFGSLGVLGPKAVTDIAISAQNSGYKSFWTVEANGTDAMSLLGAVSHQHNLVILRVIHKNCG